MTTGAGDPLFVDTNTLVHATAIEAPWHDAACTALEGLHERGADLWISRQVLREYLATFTRPQSYMLPRTVPLLVQDVRRFGSRFRVAEDNAAVTERLLELLERIPLGGKPVHDANIVATMQVHSIRRLFTQNIADFARFGSVITVIPLRPTA